MRRVPRLSLVLATLLALPSTLAGAEVDEVLDRYIEARGGVKAWEAIDSLTLTGQYTSFSKLAPFVFHHQRDGKKTRFESLMNEHPFVYAYDGVTYWGEGWAFFPEWHQRLSKQDELAFRQDVDLPSALFYARERGYELSLLGPTEVDGIPALRIELVRPDGEKETWYLDPDTYLEVARDSSGSNFGRPAMQRHFFDDFREVAGVQIPHFVEAQFYTRHRIWEVESVTVNPALEAGLFAFPPPTGMAPFVGLGGEWAVTFEHRRRPDAEFESDTVTSQIEHLVGGALVQERLTEPSGNEVVYSLTFDRFREVYRLAAVNDVTTHVDVAEGTLDEEGRLVVTNLETGTAWTPGETANHFRHTFVPLEEEGGFRWEVEHSRDGGETWALLEKRTYRRP